MVYPIHVAVVDDHALFREGLSALLRDYDEIHVAKQAENGQVLVNWLQDLQYHNLPFPEVVLLDIQMPEMNGIETTVHLQNFFPQVKILILSTYADDQLVFDLMNKGASGFLPKNRKGDMVVDAIKSIAATGIYVNEQILKSMVRSWQQDQEVNKALIKFNISEREYEVIKLVAQQKSSNEIANLLGISARTVENHRKSIFEKTMTVSAPGLIIFAIKNNLLKLN